MSDGFVLHTMRNGTPSMAKQKRLNNPTTRESKMFELQKQKVRFKSMNTRTEKHGEEDEPATDLYFSVTIDNAALDMFQPDLKSSLYKQNAAPQGALIEDLRSLRLPDLKMPLVWKYKGIGYKSIFHYGMNNDKEVNLFDNEVLDFKFDCKDGGSVLIDFRIIAHPEKEEVAEFYDLMGSEIELTLIAPTPDEVQKATPQTDMLDEGNSESDDDDSATAGTSVLYPRAVASVRSTKNPTVSALQTEFKITMNEALELLMEMEEHGVIEKDGDEYVVIDEDAAA
jgi:hypothetical protein